MKLKSLNLDIYDFGIEQFINELESFSRENVGLLIHLCNAYTLSIALVDSEFCNILRRSSYNVPDGRPLSFLINRRTNVQVRGFELVNKALSNRYLASQKNLFYGSTKETIAGVEDYIKLHFGKTLNATFLSAPVIDPNDFDYSCFAQYLRNEKIEIIWLGLGTPKQDIFADYLYREMQGEITIIPIGAAFDFMNGTRKSAPAFISYLGFEWMFRLLSDPLRLWKRYTINNLLFIYLIINEFRLRIFENKLTSD